MIGSVLVRSAASLTGLVRLTWLVVICALVGVPLKEGRWGTRFAPTVLLDGSHREGVLLSQFLVERWEMDGIGRLGRVLAWKLGHLPRRLVSSLIASATRRGRTD